MACASAAVTVYVEVHGYTAVVALRELLALVEDGLLVRNTTNDGHLPSYLAESTRLVKALAAARAVLDAPAPMAWKETP